MRIFMFIFSVIVTLLVNISVYADSMNYTTDNVVEEMSNLGLICGDENGDLNLDGVITRAEFATVFARVLWLYRDDFSRDLNRLIQSDSPNPFVDINSNDWFYGYALILDLNSISGFSNNNNVEPTNLFRPFEGITGAELREAFILYTFEHYTYRIVYEENNFENVTKVHYPQCSKRPLTRKQAFLMIWDMINETISYMVTYESDVVDVYPSHVLIHEDIIEDDGNSKHYITPLIKCGYSRVFGKVDSINKGRINYNVTESKNLQNQAYGAEYNNSRNIIITCDCDNLNIGEEYYLLIKENPTNKDEFKLIYASKNRPTEPYRTDIWEEIQDD